MSLHKENRDKLLARLIGANLSPNSVVLLQGGKSPIRDYSDNEPLFRQEGYFQYLFGVKEPDFYGAIDVSSGKSILFIPRLPKQYAIIMGRIKSTQEFKSMYAVDECYYSDEISTVLKNLNTSCILTLYGKNTDSNRHTTPATFEGISDFRVDTTTLFPHLTECRVTKSAREIEILRYTNKISSQAHTYVMQNVKPGMMEYEIESLFQHYVYTHGGMRNMSYTCICASGLNGSTLHYGHAGEPNARQVKDGEMVLLDMGGEYHCYTSDITRSYPINGKWTPEQRMIYTAVLNAVKAVEAELKPGVKYCDMHKLAEKVILTALLENGLIKGDLDEMMEARLGALFMPHGLGHFFGLDTHDVGGYVLGTERSPLPGLKSLRTDRALEEGMTLTVEPGCYFVRSVLEESWDDPKWGKFLVKDRLMKFLDFGGVRIEDDVLITKDGFENLTTVVREIEDIEEVMKHKSC